MATHTTSGFDEMKRISASTHFSSPCTDKKTNEIQCIVRKCAYVHIS